MRQGRARKFWWLYPVITIEAPAGMTRDDIRKAIVIVADDGIDVLVDEGSGIVTRQVSLADDMI